MSAIRLVSAAAVAAFIALPAFAQPADPNMQDQAPPADQSNYAPPPPPADSAGVNASGVVLLSSPTPPEQAAKLKAGDPTVISNQPVADTPENRARYGAPMSNAGKHTAPQGN